MDLNLSDILSDTAQTVNQFAGVQGQIANVTGTLNNITQQKVDLDNQTADAAATVKSIELTTQAQQEATRKAIAARLGTDATLGTGWLIGKAADDMQNAKANVDDAAARIHAKESVNFMDNPLGWIAGKLTIGSDYADYNYWASQYNNNEKLAQGLEQMTQQAFVTNNNLTSTVTQAYTDAAKVVAGFQYKNDALNSAAQGARWNLDGIVQGAQISKDRLQMLYSANSAIMQQKQFGLEQERMSLQRQEFDLRKQALAEKTDEDSLVLRYIQRGYFNLTGQQMDQGRAKDALILFKSKQPQIMSYFQNGLESSQLGGKPIVSLSPYDASQLVATRVAQNLSPAMQQVGEQLITWRREFESPAMQAQLQLDPKDKTAKERAFNTFVSQKLQGIKGNIPADSIFAPASLKSTASINPTIQNLPVWKNVLKPAADAGVNIDDPNTAFSVITAAMNSNKLSYVDAIDYATAIRAGLELNNQSRNFIGMGLPPVRTYNTQVSVPGTIGKTTINLADDKALATAFNRMAARTLTQRALSGVGAGTGFNTDDITPATMPDITMPNAPKFGPKPTYPGDEEARLRAIRLGRNNQQATQ